MSQAVAALGAFGSFLTEGTANYTAAKGSVKSSLKAGSAVVDKMADVATDVNKLANAGQETPLPSGEKEKFEDYRATQAIYSKIGEGTYYEGPLETHGDAHNFVKSLKQTSDDVKVNLENATKEVVSNDKVGSRDKDGFPTYTGTYEDAPDALKTAAAIAAYTKGGVMATKPTKKGRANASIPRAKVDKELNSAPSKFLSKWTGSTPLSQIPDQQVAAVPWRQVVGAPMSKNLVRPGGAVCDTNAVLSAIVGGAGEFSLGIGAFVETDLSTATEYTDGATFDFTTEDEMSPGQGWFVKAGSTHCRTPIFFTNPLEAYAPGQTNNTSETTDFYEYFTRTQVLEHFMSLKVSGDYCGTTGLSTAYAGNPVRAEFAHILTVLVRFENDTSGTFKLAGMTGQVTGNNDDVVNYKDSGLSLEMKLPLRYIINYANNGGGNFKLWAVLHSWINPLYIPDPVGEAVVGNFATNCFIGSSAIRSIASDERSNYDELNGAWSLIDTSKPLDYYIGSVSQGIDGEPTTTLWALVRSYPGSNKFTQAVQNLMRSKTAASLVTNFAAAGGTVPSDTKVVDIGWWFNARESDGTIRSTALRTALAKDWQKLLYTDLVNLVSMGHLITSDAVVDNSKF
jgi:hypothetical protein